MKRYERRSLSGFDRDVLIQGLLDQASLEFNQSPDKPIPIEEWVENIKLPSGPFTFENHEYEKGILEETSPRQVLKKGTQLGISETQILKTIYGLLYGVISSRMLISCSQPKTMFMILAALGLGLFL